MCCVLELGYGLLENSMKSGRDVGNTSSGETVTLYI